MRVVRRTALRAPLALTAASAASELPAAPPINAAAHLDAVPQVSATPADPTTPFGVLVVTATTGYRHDSIPTATETIRRVGQDSGAFITTVIPEATDLPLLTPELLAQQGVVCFVCTSGELPLTNEQKQALLDFVRAGGGFFGAHSATDTFYEWPEYGELIGAYFREHPWSQPVTLRVEDLEHPATRMLPPSFEIADEIYVFRNDLRARPDTRILLSLDTSSVGFSVPSAGAPNDFPLAWCSSYGAGRVLYTALGHADAVWQDPRFTAHLHAALHWLAGRPM